MTEAFQSRNGHDWTEETRLLVLDDIADADHQLLAMRRTFSHMIDTHGDTPEGAYLALATIVTFQGWEPLLLARMLARLMMVAYEKGQSDAAPQ